jgi:hypothetical protein
MAQGQRRLRRMGGSRHAGVASRGTPTEPMIGEHHSSSVLGERCACSRVSYRVLCVRTAVFRFPYCSVRHTSTAL